MYESTILLQLIFGRTVAATTSSSVIANCELIRRSHLTGKPRLIWEYNASKTELEDLAGTAKNSYKLTLLLHTQVSNRARVQCHTFLETNIP